MEHPISFGIARAGATLLSVRAYNQRILLLNLLRHQPVSRIRLARLCGLSTTAVTNMVAGLLARGVVREAGTDLVAARPGAGRPPQALQLVPDSRLVLGIHIGVRRARLALCDVNAQPLAGCEAPLVAHESAGQSLARIAAAASGLIEQEGQAGSGGRLLGVGVGASGLTDVETGINVFAPNLGWRNVALRDILREQLRLPVTVDNNVRCMALAESLYGAGAMCARSPMSMAGWLWARAWWWTANSIAGRSLVQARSAIGRWCRAAANAVAAVTTAV